MTSRELVSAVMSFTPTVAMAFRLAVSFIVVVTFAPVVTAPVIVITAAIANVLVAANRAGAEDGEGSVGVPASFLNYNVAVTIVGAPLVNGVVVPTLANLAPYAIDRTAPTVAAIGSRAIRTGSAKDNPTDSG